MDRMKEIETRLAAIRQEAQQEGADLDALTKEANDLQAERKALLETAEKRNNLLKQVAGGELGTVVRSAPEENVYQYFGTNAKILQNAFNEDEWNAYYEGKVEPWAIQASLVLTNMTFSEQARARGNEIILTANRLQYASNTTKLNIVTQLFDRGFLTHNEGLEIFNMPPVEGGDKHYIRREYTEVDKLDSVGPEEYGQGGTVQDSARPTGTETESGPEGGAGGES